jgi:leucyl-tRNA synthetase
MYNHDKIEKKWQEFWEKNKTFKSENISNKPKFYALDMFPYPSGAWLHVWHPEWYTANDIMARYKHANWFNVLHPMWWDAFWLPAENYAIKTWTHPSITTAENIATFKRQIKSLWFSYDWDREIDTTDPKYYKWTQWIFAKLFEKWLAYEQDLPINFCPSCKTGLANEEVLANWTCERCGTVVEKRKIRQWVLAITKYADRLAQDVEDLDWPEWIKDMQRKWIWRSEGCEFEMKKAWDETKSIRVYTTRIDTVFGMTYAVIAPDHKDIQDFITPEQKEACDKYISDAKNKSDLDRTWTKEKTWVFSGFYVINPFNGEKVPVYIWDYVLWNYGTWAVMAVPAHDERDFEFAKKFGIQIKQSIAPYIKMDWLSTPKSDENIIKFVCTTAIVKHPTEDKYILVKFKKSWEYWFIWGSLEEWETPEVAIKREILEETWYKNCEIEEVLFDLSYSRWYKARKDREEEAREKIFVVKLKDLEQDLSECDEHDWINWLTKEEILKTISLKHHKFFFEQYLKENKYFWEDWILINSSDFDWLTSQEAREKLTQYATEKWFWEKRVNYKLRDWLFSRQRYWWEPIPLIHLEIEDYEKLPRVSDPSEATEPNIAYIYDKKELWKRCKNCTCGDVGCVKLIINWKTFSRVYDWLYTKIIVDYNLPLELPNVDKYEPSPDGQSPLARVPDFVNVKLAENLSGKRETNTMPQWGWSCWYYLRFMDAENPEELVNPEIEKYWGSVDSYVGWAEHAVLHLLYARFWHKFLYDIWVVSTIEPFHRLRNQWMILAFAYETKNGWLVSNDLVEEKDGKYFHKETKEELSQIVAKMSKSLKNVVNPDDIVKEFWADTLRLYEMYMCDFKDSAPWDPKNIIWVKRFLDKVWNIFENGKEWNDDKEAMKNLHKTIKKVGEDIENYKFNTAIAQMMILANYWTPKDESLRKEWLEKFAIILHPFVPHFAEELWEIIWNKESIFNAEWPKYDESLTLDDVIVIWIQVLGKLRGELEINVSENKENIISRAKEVESVKKWLEGKEIVKEIYVPWKIVNIVVK